MEFSACAQLFKMFSMKINLVGILLLVNIFSYVVLDNFCTEREDLGAKMPPGVFQLCPTSESESDRNCQNCPEAHSACQVTLCSLEKEVMK